MKKRLMAGFALLMLAVVFWMGDITGYAGFGDFNNYDYGGTDSDWGGFDSSSGSDYSWGGDIGYYGNYGSSDEDADMMIVVIVVALIVLVSIVMEANKRKQRDIADSYGSTQSRNSNRVAKALPDRTNEITKIIKERDPNFTANDFIPYVKRVYVDIQDAWCKRDLTPVQKVLHPNLYQQTQTQIEKKIADGIVNHLERIAVNTAYLSAYQRDAEYEYLIVYLAAQMVDYQVKEETGHIVNGDTHTRWDMRYKMTFMRAASMLTPDSEDEDDVMRCPNCGAPIEGTAFGTCEYCGSVVSTGKYGWVLSDFGVVRDDTRDEGIHVDAQ